MNIVDNINHVIGSWLYQPYWMGIFMPDQPLRLGLYA